MKYITLFNNYQNYYNYIISPNKIQPNLSFCDENNKIFCDEISFFIYHSSDCTIERVLAKSFTNFSFENYVKDGYIYGGTFTEYGGSGDICAQIQNGDFSAFNNNNIVNDINCSAYDGSSVNVTGTTKFFKKPKILTTKINPQENNIYFLKEVPNDYYFKIYTTYLYDTNTNKIQNITFILNIDDTIYKPCNLIYNNISYKLATASSASIYNISYNSNDLFGRRGYICINSTNSINNFIFNANNTYIFTFNIITYDDVKITRYAKVKTHDLDVNNFEVTYYDSKPTID